MAETVRVSTLDFGFLEQGTQRPVHMGFVGLWLSNAVPEEVARVRVVLRDREEMARASKDSDRCLLLLMFRHGLRVSEATKLIFLGELRLPEPPFAVQ